MKNQKVSDSGDKVSPDHRKLFTPKDVEQLLRKDLHTAILCLQSVHDDQDALSALAIHLHGKYMNARHLATIKETEFGVPVDHAQTGLD